MDDEFDFENDNNQEQKVAKKEVEIDDDFDFEEVSSKSQDYQESLVGELKLQESLTINENKELEQQNKKEIFEVATENENEENILESDNLAEIVEELAQINQIELEAVKENETSFEMVEDEIEVPKDVDNEPREDIIERNDDLVEEASEEKASMSDRKDEHLEENIVHGVFSSEFDNHYEKVHKSESADKEDELNEFYFNEGVDKNKDEEARSVVNEEVDENFANNEEKNSPSILLTQNKAEKTIDDIEANKISEESFSVGKEDKELNENESKSEEAANKEKDDDFDFEEISENRASPAKPNIIANEEVNFDFEEDDNKEDFEKQQTVNQEVDFDFETTNDLKEQSNNKLSEYTEEQPTQKETTGNEYANKPLDSAVEQEQNNELLANAEKPNDHEIEEAKEKYTDNEFEEAKEKPINNEFEEADEKLNEFEEAEEKPINDEFEEADEKPNDDEFEEADEKPNDEEFEEAEEVEKDIKTKNEHKGKFSENAEIISLLKLLKANHRSMFFERQRIKINEKYNLPAVPQVSLKPFTEEISSSQRHTKMVKCDLKLPYNSEREQSQHLYKIPSHNLFSIHHVMLDIATYVKNTINYGDVSEDSFEDDEMEPLPELQNDDLFSTQIRPVARREVAKMSSELFGDIFNVKAEELEQPVVTSQEPRIEIDMTADLLKELEKYGKEVEEVIIEQNINKEEELLSRLPNYAYLLSKFVEYPSSMFELEV